MINTNEVKKNNDIYLENMINKKMKQNKANNVKT